MVNTDDQGGEVIPTPTANNTEASNNDNIKKSDPSKPVLVDVPEVITNNEDQKEVTTTENPAVMEVTPVQGSATTTTEEVVPLEPERKMRAVVLTSFGGLKNVKVQERPVPLSPGEGQVIVEIKMSGLNFQDVLLRLGLNDVSHPKTPFTLGTECLGTIVKVGSGVTKVQVDDLVFAVPENGGAWAEFMLLNELNVFKVSKPSLPLEILAFSFNYCVAELLLSRAGNLEPGATVLVHSAGGGVGLALRELAGLRGIDVVGIASASKHEALAEYGFKHLIRRGQDYVAEVKKLYPGGLDAVFDPQGGDDIARGISILAPWGTYILYGSANLVTGENKGILTLAKSWWKVEKQSLTKLYEDNRMVGGFNFQRLLQTRPALVERTFGTIWELMEQGKVHPVKDMSFHYEQMSLAMQRMHERKNIGKILILPELEIVIPVVEATTTTEVPAVVEAATPATEVKEIVPPLDNIPTTNGTGNEGEEKTPESATTSS